MKVGVIVAMDKEMEQMRSLLGGRCEGIVGTNEIVVHRSGMGKVNAALKAAELINEYPLDCMISTGVAGGLAPGLKSMDLIAARQVAYHDAWYGDGNVYGQVQGLPARFATNETLYNTAIRTGARGGLVCSGDFFVNTAEDADRILSHFPEGMAVDMESGALAQTCYLHDIPFLSIRIISDVAGENHQAEYDNFWENIAEGSFGAIHRFLEALPSSL